MFRETVCPSSGETAVFVWHLVLVILWMTVWYEGAYAPAWLSGMEEHMLLHDCLVWRSIWLSGMEEHMLLHDSLVWRSIWLVWGSICSCMTVWYGGAYAPAWLSGMEEHMLLNDCLIWRSICSWMTVWYGGAYAPAWLSGMEDHMLLHDCLVWRSIWLSCMEEHMLQHTSHPHRIIVPSVTQTQLFFLMMGT